MVASTPFPNHLSERLPNCTIRYDDHKTGTAQATTIIAGRLGAELSANEDMTTTEVPQDWTKCVNPAEGRVYFRNSTLRLVTEAFIQSPWILEHVMHWYQVIVVLLEHYATNFELFLDVEETRGGVVGACSYYLVDYGAYSVFWLRNVSTGSLELPNIRNPDHLKHLLEEQFWVHMEYMPRPDLDLRVVTNQLLASLAVLAIDASTSAGSISPFSPEECKAYSQELKQVLDTKSMVDINWCTARIKSLLTQSRTVNLHGEPGARTDRAMVVNGQHPPPVSPAFMAASLGLFFAPNAYLRRWNSIWIDRVVYTREWRRLVKEITEEWLFSAKMSGICAIVGVGFHAVFSSTVIRSLAALAMILAIPNSAYSMALVMHYRGLGHHAADGAAFIQKNESSVTGLQTLALVCSIPGAMVMWCSALLSFATIWPMLLEAHFLMFIPLLPNTRQVTVVILLAGTYLYGRGNITLRLGPR